MNGGTTMGRGGSRTWMKGLVALGLAAHVLLPGTAAAAEPTTGEPGAATPRATAPEAAVPGATEASGPAPRTRARRSALDTRVATLTRALGLDAKQQVELRRVLLAQRDQMQKIWSDESVSAAQRVGATRALSDRTSDRIRALLNAEQRKRYNPEHQHQAGEAPGQAHVEDWMPAGKKH